VQGWWWRVAAWVRTKLPMSSVGLVVVNCGAGQDEKRWHGAGRGDPVQGCWRTGGARRDPKRTLDSIWENGDGGGYLTIRCHL
jgi:hypothetical protein